MENFLTQQIDLLIISPNEATPLTAVVKKAYDKGIPVLVLDRKVDGDAYTSFIGADNVDIGKQAGEYIEGAAAQRRQDRRDPRPGRVHPGQGTPGRVRQGHRGRQDRHRRHRRR